VRTVKELERYPWSGHSRIVGMVKREWQDTEEILRYFEKGRRVAVKRYIAFIEEGVSQGKRPELVGGGLLRSVGGRSEVVSMRRLGMGMASDERILGSGRFVERVIAKTEAKGRETLRLRRKVPELRALLREVGEREGLDEKELRKVRKVRRTREAVRVIKVFCQLAVRKHGYTGASVARFLGVTTSLVNRYAVSGGLLKLGRYT
jgi:putative transposase